MYIYVSASALSCLFRITKDYVVKRNISFNYSVLLRVPVRCISTENMCLMLIILTSPLILCVAGCPCGWPRRWRPWWLCTWLSGQTLPRAVQWTFPEGPGASTRSVKIHRTILYISNLIFTVVLCSLLCGHSKTHVFMWESKHHTHTVYQPLVCMSGC